MTQPPSLPDRGHGVYCMLTLTSVCKKGGEEVVCHDQCETNFKRSKTEPTFKFLPLDVNTLS